MSNTTDSFKQYQNIRHDTRQIFLKCPHCLLNSKNPRFVKTHKNLSSLDFHLSKEHKDEFLTKEVQILIKQFAKGFRY